MCIKTHNTMYIYIYSYWYKLYTIYKLYKLYYWTNKLSTINLCALNGYELVKSSFVLIHIRVFIFHIQNSTSYTNYTSEPPNSPYQLSNYALNGYLLYVGLQRMFPEDKKFGEVRSEKRIYILIYSFSSTICFITIAYKVTV